MESFVSTFHIDWKIIIAQAINFAVVVFVLYRFAIKPLKKNLDERKNTIEQGLSDAKTNAELLVSAKNDYEKMLADARASDPSSTWHAVEVSVGYKEAANNIDPPK